MNKFEGQSPAKIILLGEHFVVHGAPALAAPLAGVGLQATLCRTEHFETHPDHVTACLGLCRQEWDGPLPEQIRCDIDSDIPQRIGLGSSAALAVALARAYAKLCGQAAKDSPAIRRVAHLCEKIAHGHPSGIDTAAVLSARPIRFRVGAAPVALATDPTMAFVIVDVGVRAPTLELVDRVRRLRERRPGQFRAALAEYRGLAERATAALANDNPFGLAEAMNRNQLLLRQLGVSTPAVERAIRDLREAGALGAKLTGAGGGGAVVGIVEAQKSSIVAGNVVHRGHNVLVSRTKES